jgi:beta-glucanase (GH16 family)
MASVGSTANKRIGFFTVSAVLAIATGCQVKTGGLASHEDAGARQFDAGTDARSAAQGDARAEDSPTSNADAELVPGTGGADGGSSQGGATGDANTASSQDAPAMGDTSGGDGAVATGDVQAVDAEGAGGSSGHDGSVGDVAVGPGPDSSAEPDADEDLAPVVSPDASLASDTAEPTTDAVARPDRFTGPDARDAREPQVDSKPARTPVWADEFNGPTNAGIDTTKWTQVTWAPGHVNNEKQQYTSSPNNVFLDGEGHLVLRALYTPMAMSPYTSGRIDSSGKASFGPGHRVEVRAKLPSGTGSFPGIVMLGTTGTWPQNGELALMEQYGQDKSWFYASATAGSAPGSGSTGNLRYDFANATTASTDFHVYALDWYDDHVVFTVDDDTVGSGTFTTTSPLYVTPEYIVIDLALGGTMGGAIDNADFPMDMIVDYVRVFEL